MEFGIFICKKLTIGGLSLFTHIRVIFAALCVYLATLATTGNGEKVLAIHSRT
jgi:hypothetical protein